MSQSIGSTEDIVGVVRSLSPAGSIVKGGPIACAQTPLFPEEEVFVAHAVEQRRREFRAGRTYARQALAELDLAAAPISMSHARGPSWPVGCVGSISHTRSLCAVVAARTDKIRSIGLDLECDEPLDRSLIPLVCSEQELRNRSVFEKAAETDLPKLIFSAKESFYKLYNPLAGSFLEFSDLEIAIDPALNGFIARLVNRSRPSFPGIGGAVGRFHHLPGTIVTVAFLAEDATRGGDIVT